MAGIFKAYDIRGLYPEKINGAVAEKVGRAFAAVTGIRHAVVGRDMRDSSTELFEGLVCGLTASGVDVTDIGSCSTPILYYSVGTLKADGGVMITASHNPGCWNGLKLCLKDAFPISRSNGLKEIEKSFLLDQYEDSAVCGSIRQMDMTEKYGRFIRHFAKFDGKKPKVVCDFGNGMGRWEIAGVRDLFDLIPMYEEPDGSFPNHEANPLNFETLQDLQAKVLETGADFGIAFDGDADRCGFVDDRGEIISMDLFTALIASDILKDTGPAVILYDLRSSHAVPEYISEHGGTPVMTPVGHSFIKKKMRETGAAFAGELSGHYYFRENFCAESQALALVKFANLLCRSGKSAGELTEPLRRYFSTGELNFEVHDISAVLQKIKDIYSVDGELFELDGISGEYGDWRFNVRSSNTEPLLRLMVEADTEEKMKMHRDRLISVISGSFL
ncbi:MAG: phosphomannomutase/phosphoglucomutase [Lentisphaeria bacterium]|nr:phosphomannomutase/phosphoglucomutase [Lentisphaeria bacterium]